MGTQKLQLEHTFHKIIDCPRQHSQTLVYLRKDRLTQSFMYIR